ncbi:actin binding protein [Balamuthia mandrillaris]
MNASSPTASPRPICSNRERGDVAEVNQEEGALGMAAQKQVRVLYDYEAEEEGEMTLLEDDIITVLAEEPSGWWKGELNGQVGVFPINFTEPYVAGPSSQQAPPPPIRNRAITDSALVGRAMVPQGNNELIAKLQKRSNIITSGPQPPATSAPPAPARTRPTNAPPPAVVGGRGEGGSFFAPNSQRPQGGAVGGSGEGGSFFVPNSQRPQGSGGGLGGSGGGAMPPPIPTRERRGVLPKEDSQPPVAVPPAQGVRPHLRHSSNQPSQELLEAGGAALPPPLQLPPLQQPQQQQMGGSRNPLPSGSFPPPAASAAGLAPPVPAFNRPPLEKAASSPAATMQSNAAGGQALTPPRPGSPARLPPPLSSRQPQQQHIDVSFHQNASSYNSVTTVVTAAFSYVGKEEGELSFREGESISVTIRDPSGWWQGVLSSGTMGWFPSEFVRAADEERAQRERKATQSQSLPSMAAMIPVASLGTSSPSHSLSADDDYEDELVSEEEAVLAEVKAEEAKSRAERPSPVPGARLVTPKRALGMKGRRLPTRKPRALSRSSPAGTSRGRASPPLASPTSALNTSDDKNGGRGRKEGRTSAEYERKHSSPSVLASSPAKVKEKRGGRDKSESSAKRASQLGRSPRTQPPSEDTRSSGSSKSSPSPLSSSSSTSASSSSSSSSSRRSSSTRDSPITEDRWPKGLPAWDAFIDTLHKLYKQTKQRVLDEDKQRSGGSGSSNKGKKASSCRSSSYYLQGDALPLGNLEACNLFAIAVCTVDGRTWERGQCEVAFPLTHSVHPLLHALCCQEYGRTAVRNMASDVTGNGGGKEKDPFQVGAALKWSSMVKGGVGKASTTPAERITSLLEVGNQLAADQRVSCSMPLYLSLRSSADAIFAQAYSMKANGVFSREEDVATILDFYFQACSLEMDCRSLSSAAATLANSGVCPLTQRQCLSPEATQETVKWMARSATGGPLAAKTGPAGSLLLVIPKVMGLALYSPLLDGKGQVLAASVFCEGLMQAHPQLSSYTYNS